MFECPDWKQCQQFKMPKNRHKYVNLKTREHLHGELVGPLVERHPIFNLKKDRTIPALETAEVLLVFAEVLLVNYNYGTLGSRYRTYSRFSFHVLILTEKPRFYRDRITRSGCPLFGAL